MMRHAFTGLRWRLTSAATAVTMVLCALAVRTATPAQSVDQAIRGIVERSSLQSAALTPLRRAALVRLYEPGNYGPLWVVPSGRPGDETRVALDLLKAAASDGLDPADYSAAFLEQALARITRTEPPPVDEIASFDVGLSLNVIRYVEHLHLGRVQPGAMGFRLPAHESSDLIPRLRMAIAERRVAAFAADLAPRIPLYRRLRLALDTYRQFAGDRGLELQLPSRTIRPGDRSEALPGLHRLLVALGDLPADNTNRAIEAYEEPLIDAVKHFQSRHGLAADGVIGNSTRAALAVPLGRRVQQIELAMERLRWLPDLGSDRFIAVNIPMFHAWGLEGMEREYQPSFDSAVIVGRALNTRTPVFVEEMEYVIFRPYWNVPASIVRNEILPAVRRSADYLQRHNMELVSGQADDAVVVPITPAALERLGQGRLRLRQRPGVDNSLGLVKFVFPNDDNVYMHGTPAPELFQRSRRDFSHGCIRVADPIGLAQWVLADTPGWPRDRIAATMFGHESARVNLTRPTRVIIFYLTAVVLPGDRSVRFVEDLYGHDARLERYLSARAGRRSSN